MFGRELVIAILSALVLPALTWARGQGSDFYFLSPNGMATHLGMQDRRSEVVSDVDVHADLVYQRVGKKLRAKTFGGKTLWTIDAPSDDGRYFFDSGSGVLSITQNLGDWWLGLDPKTGKEVFRKARIEESRTLRWPPDIETMRDSQRHRYCLSDVDGKPQQLHKFDQQTGKLVWQIKLPDKVRQYGDLLFASVGIVRFENGTYCFHPENGAELTEVPTEPKTTRQIFWHEDGVFHLSTDEPATLTAYDPATGKTKWSVKDLKDAFDLVGPYAHQRLLCRGQGVLHVIDTKAGKLLTSIKSFAYPRGVFQAKDTIVAYYTDPKYHVESFELPSGKMSWSRSHGSYNSPVALWNDRVMIVEPAKNAKRREQQPPPVSVVSLKDGKELWRWQVPPFKGFYDNVWASVRATQSGFVVTRTWRVLD
jgi:outer membrane protein assembly factor BamB